MNTIFSKDRKYRYCLYRWWDKSKPFVMFIGLNPSIADEENDDPTLVRCMNFAKSWGYGGVCMTNLFAYVATKPADMKTSIDPVGTDNDYWLTATAKEAGVIIAAWGNDGAYLDRSNVVRNLLPDLSCLKLNQSGEPTHPLYLNKELKPIPFGVNNL